MNSIPQFPRPIITFENIYVRPKFRCKDKCYFFVGSNSSSTPTTIVGGETKGHFWEDAQHPKASFHGNAGYEPFDGFTSPAVNDGKGEREMTPADDPHSSVNQTRFERGQRFSFPSHPEQSIRSNFSTSFRLKFCGRRASYDCMLNGKCGYIGKFPFCYTTFAFVNRTPNLRNVMPKLSA